MISISFTCVVQVGAERIGNERGEY